MACINVIDLSTTTWLIINALKAQMLDTYLYLVNQMSVDNEREMLGESIYMRETVDTAFILTRIGIFHDGKWLLSKASCWEISSLRRAFHFSCWVLLCLDELKVSPKMEKIETWKVERLTQTVKLRWQVLCKTFLHYLFVSILWACYYLKIVLSQSS